MIDHQVIRAEARRLAGEMWAGQADGSRARPRFADGARELMVNDLDSFSLLELALHLERMVGVPLLDDLADFAGGTVDDLAMFAVELAARYRPDLTE